MSIVQPSSFNASKITISEPKKLDNGSRQSYLNYNGGRLRVQVPRMPIPMDASDYNGNGKFKVNLSFRDRESNPKVAAFYDMLDAIDNALIQNATDKSGVWFKKPGMSRDVVESKFTKSIRISVDKEGNPKPYPPTCPISLKKNFKTGAFDAEIYDKEKRLIEGRTPVEVLRRGCEITPILECTGIWLTEAGFGATWKLFQARLDVSAEGLEPGCAILDDDEDDAAPVTKSAKPAAAAAKPVFEVADEEEEDLMAAVKPTATSAAAPVAADEEEDEDVVEAPPVPKKTVVTKKVVKKMVKA